MRLSSVASFFAERWQSTLIDFGSSHWAKCLVGGAVAPVLIIIIDKACGWAGGKKRPSLVRLRSVLILSVAACALDPFPYARRIAAVAGGVFAAVFTAAIMKRTS